MGSGNFRLILERSDEDAELFSEEYQKELSNFASQADISSQRRQTNDSFSGGSWALGEFLFSNVGSLIEALAILGAAWIQRRSGRKLRIKVGEVEIEANNKKEIEQMISHIRDLQEKQKGEDDR